MNQRRVAARSSVLRLLAAGAIAAGGCGDGNGHAGQDRPRQPGLDAETGYREGFNAGRRSATDLSMDWTWLWTQSDEYRGAYDQGWKEGRNLRKLEDERDKRPR